ncbi:MAG: DUF4215 domain-containing protein [Polyangia bacterium]|jgi:cysteine-rich repeat protein|nr:DUF4215 domain-containing protein [Polyangia bacterium]
MRAPKSRLLFSLFLGGVTTAALQACDEAPEGTLEVHWMVNGDRSAAACSAGGVTTVRVLADHSGNSPDPDPANPTWSYRDFACADLSGGFPLGEGIYRVRVVALDAGGSVRSKIIDFQGIQVVGGQVRSIPQNPAIEPPVDLEIALCGDGVLQSGEWCDGEDLGGYDCLSRGFDGGVLSCTQACTLDESLCHRCGDGAVDPGESCDGSDLGGQSCESHGLTGGPLACAADCTLDLSQCTGCGNGVLEGDEECDDANALGGDGCSPDCRLEEGPISLVWSVVSSDASTLSDCAAEGIAQVEVSLTISGTGTVVDATRLPCSDGAAEFGEIGYGLYTLRLAGLDGSDAVVARGSLSVIDHSLPEGTAVSIDLLVLP